MSWAKSDNRLFDKQMVKCDEYCEWFTECVSAYLKDLLMRNTLNGIDISVYY